MDTLPRRESIQKQFCVGRQKYCDFNDIRKHYFEQNVAIRMLLDTQVPNDHARSIFCQFYGFHIRDLKPFVFRETLSVVFRHEYTNSTFPTRIAL